LRKKAVARLQVSLRKENPRRDGVEVTGIGTRPERRKKGVRTKGKGLEDNRKSVEKKCPRGSHTVRKGELDGGGGRIDFDEQNRRGLISAKKKKERTGKNPTVKRGPRIKRRDRKET